MGRATTMAAAVVVAVSGVSLGCVVGHRPPAPAVRTGRIVPGITVLLEDSLRLVSGKRVGLLTNQTGLDRSGEPDAELLTRSRVAVSSGVTLVALFSPEHGLRGREDRQFVAGGVDTGTRVPVYSLYGATVLEPPDSLLAGLDVLVIDLQDIGTRTWTYVASMRLRDARRRPRPLPVVVLDRPNPITGSHAEGPMLDSALGQSRVRGAGPSRTPVCAGADPSASRAHDGRARTYYNDVLGLRADLHVVPVRGWRRARLVR